MTKSTDEKRSATEEKQAKPPQRIDAPRIRRSIGVSQDVAKDAALPAPSAPKAVAQKAKTLADAKFVPTPTRYSDGAIVSADRQKAHLPPGWWPQHMGAYVNGRQVACLFAAAVVNGDAEYLSYEHVAFAELPILVCECCRPRIVVGGPR